MHSRSEQTLRKMLQNKKMLRILLDQTILTRGQTKVETEKFLTRPKAHELADRKTKTDLVLRNQSVKGDGPS